jgi:hypothetical protein
MGLLDKLLAVALGVSLIVGGGALWYADYEHAKLAPLQQKVTLANTAAKQAVADRDTALAAAADAQKQLKIAQQAEAAAAASAAQATNDAKAARGKLDAVSKSPDVAKTLDAPLPRAVWDAIYNASGK